MKHCNKKIQEAHHWKVARNNDDLTNVKEEAGGHIYNNRERLRLVQLANTDNYKDTRNVAIKKKDSSSCNHMLQIITRQAYISYASGSL